MLLSTSRHCSGGYGQGVVQLGAMVVVRVETKLTDRVRVKVEVGSR